MQENLDGTYVIVAWSEESGAFLGSPPVVLESREQGEAIIEEMKRYPQSKGVLLDVITTREYEFTLCPVHAGQELP